MTFPKWVKNENLWILVFTIAYIASGITESEITWQVVVAVAAYIGGTSLRDFAVNFLEVATKIDKILENAGIHWEEVLEDALKKVSDEVRGNTND